MKEPYREGVADHSEPESCVGHREVPCEALTGAHPGQVLSREIELIGKADAVKRCGRQHQPKRYWRAEAGFPAVGDPGHGWKLLARNLGGLAEVPERIETVGDRTGKDRVRTPVTHVCEESDAVIVLRKEANKG